MKNGNYVVLAEGPSLKDYNESAYKDAFVIGVNTAYHTHKAKKRKYPKLDLVVAMDAPRHFQRSGKLENFLAIPDDVPLLLQRREWHNQKLIQRDNVEVRPMTRVRPGDERRFWKLDACGGTTAIAAIYEAIKLGAKDVHLYGHDFTKGWAGYKDSAAKQTLKELNFAHGLLKKQGGGLHVTEASHLWQLQFGEEHAILQLQAEKLAKKSTKKKSNSDSVS